MKRSERIVIEESILKVTNELLQEWRGKFKKFSVYSDFPFVSRTGSEATYFSEIEVNYWHEDGAFIDFFSIIIFIQGEDVYKRQLLVRMAVLIFIILIMTNSIV